MILNSYSRFDWFISQCFLGSGSSIRNFASLFPILLICLPFFINEDFKRDLDVKKRLASLPLIWTIIGLIGAFFPYDYHNTNSVVPWFLVVGLLAFFFIFSVYQIYKNKNYRLFTVTFFVINGYMVLMMSFIASMSISGSWL